MGRWRWGWRTVPRVRGGGLVWHRTAYRENIESPPSVATSRHGSAPLARLRANSFTGDTNPPEVIADTAPCGVAVDSRRTLRLP